jgi:23S rRNA (cytidine2498-2'-O)-methyltransferase
MTTGVDGATASAANLHVLFPDGAHAYVGASVAPWASPWTMGIPRLRMPGAAPSRSTLKLAEAFVTFLADREPVLLRAGMRAVDLGAAPGGWTWQLAHRGLAVTAVDNGPLKGVVARDPLVTHLRADGLTYLPRRPVDWMVCDVVEQPARIAALVARWIGGGHARHAIFNLKLPMKKRYDEVRRCEALIREALMQARVRHTLALRQLYHDREEVTGCVIRLAG